jgi:hypothetical protein
MTRKERRALQHDRELRGLPKATPWTYQKETRLRRLNELLEARDRELAADLGVSVDLVQQIRSRSQRGLEPPSRV